MGESKLLFGILQNALLAQALPYGLLDNLTEKQWLELYTSAAKQGVSAIVYYAVSRLPADRQPTRSLKIQWAIGTEAIEKRYQKQQNVANELADSYSKGNLSLIILKGLGLARYYPIPSLRECGDVDIYLTGRNNGAGVLDGQFHVEQEHSYYKHDSFHYKGVCIERHNYFTSFRGNHEIKWFERLLHKHIDEKQEYSPLGNTLLYVPNPTVNALFLVYHSMAHFLVEGITIRHLLDWGLFVKTEQDSIDWQYFYEVCDKMHYTLFINTIHSILVNQCGFSFNNHNIRFDSQHEAKVLNDILYSENNHVSGVSTWKRRYLVVKNIISSRWKYDQIYQHNFLLSMIRSGLGIVLDQGAKL